MNLIQCSKDCIYQQEGYCIADDSAPVNAVSLKDCCYYQPIKPAPNESPQSPV